MKNCKPNLRGLLFFLCLLFLTTIDINACWINFGGTVVHVNCTCAEAKDCFPQYPCVDKIDGVESNTRNVVYVISGKRRFLLASDEVQTKFDEVFNDRISRNVLIPKAELEKVLLPLIAKKGMISRARINKIMNEVAIKEEGVKM